MNGWGYALGTLGGLLLSLITLFFDNLPDFYVFPIVVVTSFLLSIVVSLTTPPVERNILTSFYRTIRPFGWWRPVRENSRLSLKELSKKSDNIWRTILNVMLGMLAIAGLYLFPMYLVGHLYAQSLLWFALAFAAIVVLAFTWYKNLP